MNLVVLSEIEFFISPLNAPQLYRFSSCAPDSPILVNPKLRHSAPDSPTLVNSELRHSAPDSPTTVNSELRHSAPDSLTPSYL